MFSYVQAVKKAVAKMEQWEAIDFHDSAWLYGNMWREQFPQHYKTMVRRNIQSNKEI